MPRIFSFKPSITLKGRKFRGVRGWAGKPSHPPFTDFPIAAYVLAAAFDLISYVAGGSDGRASSVARDAFVAATYVTIGGALLSVAAALTGFWDWWKGIERDTSAGWLGRAKHTQVWRTINTHAAIMVMATVLVLIEIVVRLGQYDQGYTGLLVLVLSVIVALLVFWGSFYGGELVYDYQFNVEPIENSSVWDETERDEMPADRPQAPH
ncbi:MAG TPA: DUF2231 domain-containing protein [Actinomycetota bacterium]|nr:DUF2231 domain-containing protein [Actinomycetota bacterium]